MNHHPQPVAALLAVAADAGIVVRIVNGQLFVKGPKTAGAIGRAVLNRKAEVFKHLVEFEVWDADKAVRRMEAADTAVAEDGARGSHPLVQAAVAWVCDAYKLRDMAGVNRGCDDLVTLVKRLNT